MKKNNFNKKRLDILNILKKNIIIDGWNENLLSIGDQHFYCIGSSTQSCYTGPTQHVDVYCDGGLWQSEVSWEIINQQGDIILSGGAPYNGVLNPFIIGDL